MEVMMTSPAIDEQALGEKVRQIYHDARGDLRFGVLLDRVGDLHDLKNADYGTDVDAYANVRGAEEWGVPGWVGAMIRASDKCRRLQQYARTGTLANEGVEDSFLDLAAYALIGLLLWQEDQGETSDG
jgi:hypothetical protein